MTTFFEQARTKTALWGESLRHVQRLAASWQPLADLCFADLLLLAPVAGEEGHRFVVLAQVRPDTGQTVYPTDLVGTVVDEVERPLRRARAGARARSSRATRRCSASTERVRVQCIPVRHAGRVDRGRHPGDADRRSGRRPGELEQHYLDDVRPLRAR